MCVCVCLCVFLYMYACITYPPNRNPMTSPPPQRGAERRSRRLPPRASSLEHTGALQGHRAFPSCRVQVWTVFSQPLSIWLILPRQRISPDGVTGAQITLAKLLPWIVLTVFI